MAMLMLMTGTLACDAGWDTLRPILGQFCGGAAGTLPSLLVLGEDDNGEDDGDDIRFLFIFLVNQHSNKLHCGVNYDDHRCKERYDKDSAQLTPRVVTAAQTFKQFHFWAEQRGWRRGLRWWCLLSSSQTFGQFHALVKFLFCHLDDGHEDDDGEADGHHDDGHDDDDDDDIWGFHFFEKSIHPPQFA